MAVFTEVSDKDARELLRRMSLGSFKELRGIQGGIENTNYFLTTEQGEWVLTLFERLTAEQLPFYLYLMKHLAQAGIPVPDPQAETRSGDILLSVCGKPASIVNRLPGKSELAPQPAHCAAVGEMLARMHLAGRRLRSPAAQSAQPALVERDRAHGHPAHRRTHGRPCCAPSWPSRTMWPPRPPMRRCRAAPCTPTCSATT